jgi:hypothetical protein
MSNLALFAVGCFVTLLGGAAMALLVLGAILDGRDEKERQEAELRALARGGREQPLRVIDAA